MAAEPKKQPKFSESTEIAQQIWGKVDDQKRAQIARQNVPLGIMTEVERHGYDAGKVYSALTRVAKEALAQKVAAENAAPAARSRKP